MFIVLGLFSACDCEVLHLNQWIFIFSVCKPFLLLFIMHGAFGSKLNCLKSFVRLICKPSVGCNYRSLTQCDKEKINQC